MSSTSLAISGSVPSVRVFGIAPDGSRQWTTYAGMNAAQASARARAHGFRVLQIEATPAAASSNVPLTQRRLSRARRFDLLLFNQELLSLLTAGLNLVEAIETLRGKSQPGTDQETLQHIELALHQGKTFSQVLESRPALFPDVYVAGVRASERTGNLPQALERFIAYQQQFDVLRRKVITASIYPLMLLVVGTLVVLFLLGFVVPRFSAVYESSGRDLPWLSTVMLAVGRFLNGNALLVAFTTAILLAAGAALVRAQGFADAGMQWLLRLPGLAQHAKTFRLSRFFRALSLLLSSGVPLLRAIGMVGRLLGSDRRDAAARLRQHVEQGVALSVALEREGLTSPVAQSLLKVGERSGAMAAMLEKAASFHDEELSRWLEGASRLLEPLLMLVIGLVIGGVVVLMYLPIFDLASSFR